MNIFKTIKNDQKNTPQKQSHKKNPYVIFGLVFIIELMRQKIPRFFEIGITLYSYYKKPPDSKETKKVNSCL